MAFLFCAHKAEQFDPSGTWTNSTSAGTFDSNYTDSSIAVPIGTNSSRAHTVAFGDGTETDIWLHMHAVNWNNSGNEDGPFIDFIGDTGENIAGLHCGTAANNVRVFYSANGTSRTQVGTTYISSATAIELDVHVQFNDAASGNITIEFYVNGTIHNTQQSVAISTNGSTGIAALKIGGDDAQGMNISEVIIANEDTRGMRLGHMIPDGAGNHSAWDGAGTDIGFHKEFQGITESTAAGRESWSLSAYSGPASPTTIHAVVNQVYCTPGNSGPSQIDSFFRISATDYDSGAVTPIPMAPNAFNWTTNPNTAVAWVTTDFGALEAGVEAVT